MVAKWKNKGEIKPDKIVDVINTLTHQSAQGITFQGFECDFAITLIKDAVIFPSVCAGIDQERIIYRAIEDATQNSPITAKNLLEKINDVIVCESRKTNRRFYLLTSMTPISNMFFKKISFNGGSIRILRKFPKEFNTRNSYLLGNNSLPSIPENYLSIIIECEAKTTEEAFEKSMREFDLERAIWLLCACPQETIEYMGKPGVCNPINIFRAGSVHTMHEAGGALLDGEHPHCWVEPNFIPENKPYELPTGFFKKYKFVKRALKKLSNINKAYSAEIEAGLIKYAQALDVSDPNYVLVKMWAALEGLAAKGDKNCDAIPSRCAFLFPDFEYHEAVIKYIKSYRNESVHSGTQYGKAKKYCYRLHMYFHCLVWFHLSNSQKFNGLEEANKFLGLSPVTENLYRDKKLIDMALPHRCKLGRAGNLLPANF